MDIKGSLIAQKSSLSFCFSPHRWLSCGITVHVDDILSDPHLAAVLPLTSLHICWSSNDLASCRFYLWPSRVIHMSWVSSLHSPISAPIPNSFKVGCTSHKEGKTLTHPESIKKFKLAWVWWQILMFFFFPDQSNPGRNSPCIPGMWYSKLTAAQLLTTKDLCGVFLF